MSPIPIMPMPMPTDMATREHVRTRILIVSDTHGKQFSPDMKPRQPVDVVIHCGDLTEHSKLDEFRQTIQLLGQMEAPLKLVIAGNHDFSLDIPTFRHKIAEAGRLAGEPLPEDLVRREYGAEGDARKLLEETGKSHGITFLDEGTHRFSLANGTSLTVYASPYTPSSSCGGEDNEWGFQYRPSHVFAIEKGTDVAITHGPPRGIMDVTPEKKRIGCQHLFAAVARAQPRVHCFGHVHNQWGGKLVSWRGTISPEPSHFSDIDNGESVLIENLSTLKWKGDVVQSASEAAGEREEEKTGKRELEGCYWTSHCRGDENALGPGKTLFVNAASKGEDDGLSQLAWLVEMDLPSS